VDDIPCRRGVQWRNYSLQNAGTPEQSAPVGDRDVSLAAHQLHIEDCCPVSAGNIARGGRRHRNVGEPGATGGGSWRLPNDPNPMIVLLFNL
jgi:hypothetical protein